MGGPKGYYVFYLNKFVHNRHKVGWIKFSKMNNIESPPEKVIKPPEKSFEPYFFSK